MRPMVLLFIALFNSILGLSVLFPILAPLGRELGLGDFEITSLSFAYALMQLLTARTWGRRSDVHGRKPILLVGILGFAASFFGFAIVAQLGLWGVLDHGPLLALLLGTRVVGGTFSSATIPTAQAYAADISTRENRTRSMAVIGAAFGLGIIFGPAIGAGIAELTGNLLAPVYFSAGVAVVNALFVALRLPEPTRERDSAEDGETAAPPRSIAKLVWPLLSVAVAVTLASVAMEQTVGLYFMDRLGLEPEEAPKLVGIALFVYGVVAVIAQGFLVRRFRWSPRTLMTMGLPLAIAGFVLFVFADTQVTLTIALALQGLGQGLLLPGVTAAFSLAVTDAEQGSVAGLNSAAQGLGRTLGPLVGGGLYEVRHELPYAFSAALLVLVLAAVALRPRLGASDEPAARA